MVTDGAPEAVLRPVRVLQTGLDSQAVGANLSPLPVELGLECDRQDAVLYSEWPCRAQQGAQDGLAGLDVVDDIGPAGLQRVGFRARRRPRVSGHYGIGDIKGCFGWWGSGRHRRVHGGRGQYGDWGRWCHGRGNWPWCSSSDGRGKGRLDVARAEQRNFGLDLELLGVSCAR